MLQKIKAGIGTWAGIISSIVLLVPAAANQIVSYIENNQANFNSGEKTTAIIGGVLLLGTILGRMAQAVAAILSKPPVISGMSGLSKPSVSVGQLSPVDQARELLTENPQLVQQLKNEGTIT